METNVCNGDAVSMSPFLSGTHIQFAWDSTSLGWLKTCPRMYQYYMIEGWKPKGTGLHLIFGQWYHSALELYDKLRQKQDHASALRAVVHDLLKWTWIDGKPWDSGDGNKNRETLVRTIIWYLEQFENDPARTVILSGGKPAVELSFRMELDYGPAAHQPYVLCGHLDRLTSFQDAYYVMDRKTTKSTLGQYYYDQYDPDNQMTLYTIAAKVIYNTPVKGVIIDAAQIAVGFSRFGRGFTYRTEEQLDEWLDNARVWFRQAEAYAREGFWPMNDKACHNYGGCAFRKVCSKTPSMRQRFLESDFDKKPWNPLEVR